ncbi:hypothetical protein RirG_225530 [Rhizophagus irregularis DAOM 197198w]|uniref:Endonuclease/exonuclease/phosphatase domain-containing protein n=2 Tax=Rhizophagus irregularis TaxID=588596 RepID=A0A015IMJ0_RHIIW|nr:hypothetical protein RirG_225530 [Rhizophagus irregularis DAOM 197198w]
MKEEMITNLANDFNKKCTMEERPKDPDAIYVKRTTTSQTNVISTIEIEHMKTEETGTIIGMKRIDIEKADTTTKENSDTTCNNNLLTNTTTTDTMPTSKEENIHTQEVDLTTTITEKMVEMRLEETDKVFITNNKDTMETTTTITTITTPIDTTRMEIITTMDTSEIGMKEIDPMIGVEWLDAIDWPLYQNTITEEENKEEGGVGEENSEKNEEENIITNKTKKEKIYKKQKQQENNKKKENKNNKLKIGCINVRGMNDTKKQGDIRKFLSKEKWDIVIINETKLKEAKGKQKNIRIIGIYNPNNDKPTTNNIEKHLAKWMNEAINLEYETIILGDFNESAKNKKKLKPLTNIIKNHGLQDIHESLTAAEDKLDTWKSGDNSSRIDFIFASEGLQESIISHEILEIEDFDTDHKALTVKIELKEKLGINKSGFMKKIKKEIRHIKLEQEDWKTIAEEVLETRLETLDQNTTQHLNRETIWKTIVEIYDEEKNRQLIKIKKRKEDSIKKRDESLTKTNEERLEELITEYENLEKIDTIEHGISKLIDKVIKKLWQDRKAFQYKHNFKEFEEKLIIEQWGTTDTGKHNAVKLGKLISIHNRLEKNIEYGITIDKLRKHRNRKELNERRTKRAEIMRSLYEEVNNLNIEINIKKRETYLEEDIGKMLNRILEKKREKINMTGLVIKENGKITIEKDKEKIKEKVLKHNKD